MAIAGRRLQSGIVPTITRISEQRRKANRRNVYLDGAFAFACNLNVVAKFRLTEGMALSADEVERIRQGEVRQDVFDAAMKFLERRLHSRNELKQKLARQEYDALTIDGVLTDLERLGYVNDAKFAEAKVEQSAKVRHHGRRRAAIELLKKGVTGESARQALDHTYDTHDSLSVARALAEKKAASLRKLDPLVARRRLAGMLMRRGFEYDVVRPVIDAVLGHHDERTEES
jgi:regulatory protein